jgi:hypothetical protein
MAFKAYKLIRLDLPAPPADRNGLVAWDRKARADLRAQVGSQQLTGSLLIRVRSAIPSEPTPLHNLTGPLVDLLEREEVIVGVITDVDARYDRVVPMCRMQITIKQMPPPSRRTPASARQRSGDKARMIAERARLGGEMRARSCSA